MQITGAKVGSWSLPAGTSCPGSHDAEVCKGCYAKKGMYRFPVVKNVREFNKQDYHRADWVDEMVKEVSKFDYFRWFDSGDIETPELARKISLVINRTRDVLHWLPTRSDKILKISDVLTNYMAPVSYIGNGGVQHILNNQPLLSCPNVAVRRSADNIGLDRQERPGVNSFVINNTVEDLFKAKQQGIYVCPVGTNPTQKSCGTCTKCYTNDKVAYVLH